MVWWEKSSHRANAHEYNQKIIDFIEDHDPDAVGLMNYVRELMKSYDIKVEF